MKLIPREKAIEDLHFASFLYGWQHSNKPFEDDPLFEAGNYFDETINETRFFSKEELIESHNAKIAGFERLVDDKPKIEATVEATFVIDAPKELSGITYFTDVLIELVEVCDTELIFIPLFKTNWFDEAEIKDRHPSTKAAYMQLKNFIGREDYSGGLVLASKTDLEKFLPIYFTLVEVNYIPYGFFYSAKLKTVFSYHYYERLWCYCLSKRFLLSLEDFIQCKNLVVNERFSFYSNK